MPVGGLALDNHGHISQSPLGEESAVVDKLINWGVCGIAGVAVLVVALMIVSQQSGSPQPPTPAAGGTNSTGQASPFTAATIERTGQGETGAVTSAAPADGAPIRPLVREPAKPKEVEVPVVIEVREHRNTTKPDSDGR